MYTNRTECENRTEYELLDNTVARCDHLNSNYKTSCELA